MAETFEAEAVGAAGVVKRVCLKRILPSYANDPHFVERFVAEAEVSMALGHGNVAQVFDFGQADGALYLAMELVDGESLHRIQRRLVQAGYLMPAALAVNVGIALCKALHHAHTLTDASGRGLGLVHRDVSPQNVLVSYEGQVKLVDFGIAAVAAKAATGEGLSGKVHYMAPEQAAGRAVDARADIFSVGAVLYELLSGRPPVEGALGAALYSLAQGRWPSLSEVAPHLDPGLCTVIDRAVAAVPEHRFQSALELQQALASWEASSSQRASEADLGGLVRFLFAQELAAAGRPADLPEDLEVRLEPWRRESVERALRQRESHGARRRGRLAAAAAVGMVLLAAGAVAFFATTRTPPTRSLQVMSLPAGARLLVDGRDTGQRTPARLSGLPAGRTVRLRLELMGHRAEERLVAPRQAVVTVRLEPVALAVSSPPPRPSARPQAVEPATTAPPFVTHRGIDAEVLAPGRYRLLLDPQPAFTPPERLRALRLDLPAGRRRRIEARGKVTVFYLREQSRLLYLFHDLEGRLLDVGTFRRRLVVPTSARAVELLVPEGEKCSDNEGRMRIDVFAGGRRRGRYRLEGRTHCLAVGDGSRPKVEGLDGSGIYRVRYEGPAEGPVLLFVGTASTSLRALGRSPDDTVVRLRPGQEARLRYVETLNFATFEKAPPGTRLRLVLEREAAP